MGIVDFLSGWQRRVNRETGIRGLRIFLRVVVVSTELEL